MSQFLVHWTNSTSGLIRSDLLPFVVAEASRNDDELGNWYRSHRPYPQVAIASDAMKRALRMLTEFGLTPASRSKVSALGGDDNSDPLADIMRDMKG